MLKQKIIIFATVFIDVIGLGIIIPVMPSYVESFGASPSVITILFSVYALFSFLSAPLLGGFSDRHGRRPILLISILSSAIGWFVFASAHSLLFLFIGRIIDGLAAGNFPIAQSVISDISKSKEERTTSLGYIGAIFGVGFLIGPFLGGVLSTVSTAFPFYFVGILSTLNFCAAYFLLPETHHGRNADHPVSLNPFTPVLQAFKKGTLRPLYVTWFMFNAIAMGSNAIFALYLAHVYGFSAYTVGLFFTAVGLIIAFNQGFALKRIWLKYFTEKQLIVYLMAAFGIGFLFMAYSALWAFIIGLVLTSFGQSVLRVAINSEVLGEASPTEKGLASGVLSAVASIASVVGPLVIGYVYEFHVSWSYILVGVLSLATMYYIQRRQFPHIEVPIQ